MELIRGLHNLSPRHHGCVMTIGSFDGVHSGHQQIIEHLRQQGAHFHLPTVLVTFEPLPQEFFTAKHPPRLTCLREKLTLLKKFKVDRVLLLRFNQSLAALSAENFVKKIIVDALGARYLLEGDDFHFGAQRDGDIKLLTQMGKEFNFEVEKLDTITYEGQRISSSLVRDALSQNDFKRANTLLGYSYCMRGRVVHGDKRGRELGVPTANIFIHRDKSPVLGIYIVVLHGIGSKPLKGVASIGYRPTVSSDNKILLEVHLFDFDQVIYGKHVSVEFLHKIRDEEKFDSLELLKTQMFKDIEIAKDWIREPT